MSVEPKPSDAQEVPVTLGFNPEPPFAASDYVPPPPFPASPKKSNAAMWIVAIVGVLMAGGVLFSLLLCGVVGFVFYLGASRPAPEMIEYTGSSAVPFDPAFSAPADDVWSDPGYVAPYDDYSSPAESQQAYDSPPDPALVEPAYVDDDYGSAFSGLYEEPAEEYDPDWQLELPQYQQDAIRELNQQRESGFP